MPTKDRRLPPLNQLEHHVAASRLVPSNSSLNSSVHVPGAGGGGGGVWVDASASASGTLGSSPAASAVTLASGVLASASAPASSDGITVLDEQPMADERSTPTTTMTRVFMRRILSRRAARETPFAQPVGAPRRSRGDRTRSIRS